MKTIIYTTTKDGFLSRKLVNCAHIFVVVLIRIPELRPEQYRTDIFISTIEWSPGILWCISFFFRGLSYSKLINIKRIFIFIQYLWEKTSFKKKLKNPLSVVFLWCFFLFFLGGYFEGHECKNFCYIHFHYLYPVKLSKFHFFLKKLSFLAHCNAHWK